MNIIFLDVDGVLNSMAYFKHLRSNGKKLHKKDEYNDISEYHLKMLSKIYEECSAKIVLTSTWRELSDSKNKRCYKMYEYLVNSLMKYNMEIISKTRVIGMDRPKEIFDWLSNREDKEDIKFVILDDDFSKENYDLYNLGDNLVETKYFCDRLEDGGLQEMHVDKAIKILKGEV